MMNLNWRRFRRHWRTALAMMLYLALAAALVASTADLAAAISAQALNRDLEKAGPADRTLLITGTRYTFRDALYEDLEESLGDVLKARLVIRHSSLPADPRPSSLEAGSVPDLTRLEVFFINREGYFPPHHHLCHLRGARIRNVNSTYDFPSPDNRTPIGNRLYLFELVGDEDDRFPLLPQVLHDLHEILYFLRGKHRRRLVKDQYFRVPVEHLHDLDPLLHAYGYILYLCVRIDV